MNKWRVQWMTQSRGQRTCICIYEFCTVVHKTQVRSSQHITLTLLFYKCNSVLMLQGKLKRSLKEVARMLSFSTFIIREVQSKNKRYEEEKICSWRKRTNINELNSSNMIANINLVGMTYENSPSFVRNWEPCINKGARGVLWREEKEKKQWQIEEVYVTIHQLSHANTHTHSHRLYLQRESYRARATKHCTCRKESH